MEKFKNNAKNKLILALPAPKDFITPQRYVRKKSMVAGWLYIVVIIIAIICASGTWSKQNSVKYIDMGYRGKIKTVTIGEYGLTRYHKTITTSIGNSTITAVEKGSLRLLADSKSLWPCSQFVLAMLIIIMFISIFQWYVTLCHSWSKFDERRTYLITSLVALSLTLIMVSCFVAYLACKPSLVDGCILSWAGWLFFVLMIGQAVLMAIHFMDKPKGLIRYGEGGVLIFEKLEGDVDSNDNAVADNSGEKSNGKDSRRSSTRKSGLKYGLLSEEQSENNKNSKKQDEQKFSYAPPPRQQQQQQSSSSSSGNTKDVKRKAPPPPLPKRNPTKKMARALYDCNGENSGELSFNEGDMLTFISDSPGSGWITCELNGVKGIVPENYVEMQ